MKFNPLLLFNESLNKYTKDVLLYRFKLPTITLNLIFIFWPLFIPRKIQHQITFLFYSLSQ